MTDFITLLCPSCGGTLRITEDIDQFACAHCGNQHVVRRSGGTVSLKPVEGLLQKTASELAIARLGKETQALKSEISHLNYTIRDLSAIRPPAVIRPVLAILAILIVTNVACHVGSSVLPRAADPIAVQQINCIAGLALSAALSVLVGIFHLVKIAYGYSDYRQAQEQIRDLEPIIRQKQNELRARSAELEAHMRIVRQQ